jgi:hypothetical protein
MKGALVLAFLLLGVGTVSAQDVIYVDSDSGSDAFDGQSPNASGTSGPKATLTGALAVASSGDVIEVEAGQYGNAGTLSAGEPSTIVVNKNNITFRVRAANATSEAEFVGRSLTIDLPTAAGQVTFQGGATNFAFTGSTVDLQRGTAVVNGVELANGVLIGRDVSDAAATGSFDLPNNFSVTYTGNASASAGAELPGGVNIGSGALTVALSANRALTLQSGGVTVNNGVVNVVTDNTAIVGTVTLDGGSIAFGDGNLGDVVVMLANNEQTSITTAETGNVTATGDPNVAIRTEELIIAGERLASLTASEIELDVTSTVVGPVVVTNVEGFVAPQGANNAIGNITVNGTRATTDFSAITVGNVVVNESANNADISVNADNGGSITVSDSGAVVNLLGGQVATGTDTFGQISASQGVVRFQAGTRVAGVNITNAGEIDFGGQNLEVINDFVRTRGISFPTGNTGTLTFVGTGASELNAGPNFNVVALRVTPTGTGTPTKTLDLTQDVLVTGTGGSGAMAEFYVAPNASVDLGSNSIVLTAAGTSNVNGPITAGAGAVQFRGAGGTLTGSGTGVYDNIIVLTTGSNDVTVPSTANFDFQGQLTLQTGGLDVQAGGNISPTASPVATVVRNLAPGSDTEITGPFNVDDRNYDLTYTGNLSGGTRTVASEFATNDLRNVTFSVSDGTVNGTVPDGVVEGMFTVNNATPASAVVVDLDVSGTDEIALAGPVMIARNATLDVDGSDVIELRSTATVAGTFVVDGTLELANNAVINGNASAAADAATANNVIVLENAVATISGLRSIGGNALVTQTGSQLSLGLLTEGTGATATPGNLTFGLVANGASVTLTTDVEALASIVVENGALALGENDLVLTTTGSFQLDASGPGTDAAGTVTAGTGEVILNDATGSLSVDANSGTIPNLRAREDAMLFSDLTVGNSFVQMAGAEIDGNGETLTLTGAALLNGSGGNNAVSGSAFTNGDVVLTNVVVTTSDDAAEFASDVRATGTVSLAKEAAIDELIIEGELELDGPTFALNNVDLFLEGDLDYDAGSITSNDDARQGVLTLNGGAGQTYDLAANLTVPSLVIDNPNGVNATGTYRTLTIGQLLVLMDGQLDANNLAPAATTTFTGLVLASDATLQREDDGSLADAPTFPGDNSLTVIYGDRDTNDFTEFSNTTGVELPNTVKALLVTDGTVRLDKNLTVTSLLEVWGDLDANGDTDVEVLTLSQGGDFVVSYIADINNVTLALPTAVGGYDLTYSRLGSPVTANVTRITGTEFSATGVDVLTINSAGDEVELADDRTINSLMLMAGSFDLDGETLSVRGNVTLDDAATFNSNTSGAELAFVADGVSMLMLEENRDFAGNVNVRINKASADDRVMITGGGLDLSSGNQTLFLDRGLLMAGNPEAELNPTVYVRLRQERATGQGFGNNDRGQGFVLPSINDNTQVSWITGNVQKVIPSTDANNLANGAGRVVFPTGDTLGNYSPFVLDFSDATPTFPSEIVSVSFVSEAPQGRVGLPLMTDDDEIIDFPSFYWQVFAGQNLPQSLIYDVNARADAFTLAGETISDLRLISRAADAVNNPYEIAGTSYDNRLIDNTQPIVVANNVDVNLNAQGTIFTYGSTVARGNGGVEPTVITAQIAHFAPSVTGNVDVYINGQRVVAGLGYAQATAYNQIAITTGSDTLDVTITAAGSTTPIDEFEGIIEDDMTYFFAVVDDEAGGIDLFGEESDVEADESGRVTVLGAHLAPVAGPVDIMVEREGVMGSLSLATGLDYGDTVGPVTLDAATYQFTVSNSSLTDITKFNFANDQGERITYVVAGLLGTDITNASRALSQYIVLPDGEVRSGRDIATSNPTEVLPTEFALIGTAPNPLRGAGQLRLDLPEAATVEVQVFDMTGRLVMEVPAATLAAGSAKSIDLDASRLGASGVYLYRVTAEMGGRTEVVSGKLTVVK